MGLFKKCKELNYVYLDLCMKCIGDIGCVLHAVGRGLFSSEEVGVNGLKLEAQGTMCNESEQEECMFELQHIVSLLTQRDCSDFMIILKLYECDMGIGAGAFESIGDVKIYEKSKTKIRSRFTTEFVIT